MIIIAGDSWGCGEWTTSGLSHKGLEVYLQENGYQVENLSGPGGSNFETVNRLEEFFSQAVLDGTDKKISGVFVFQTEWIRDFQNRLPDYLTDFANLENKNNSTCYFNPVEYSDTMIIHFLSRWQYCLSKLAVKYNKKIGLIGGCSDTMWLDNFTNEYAGLFIACQSFTNLCVNNNHRIQHPVYSTMANNVFLELCKKQSNTQQIKFLLEHVDQGLERLSVWKQHSQWFLGSHASRQGHKKLFEYLLKENYI